MTTIKKTMLKCIDKDNVKEFKAELGKLKEVPEVLATKILVECLRFKSYKCLKYLLDHYEFDLDDYIFMNYMDTDFDSGDPILFKWIEFILDTYYICCLVR